MGGNHTVIERHRASSSSNTGVAGRYNVREGKEASAPPGVQQRATRHGIAGIHGNVGTLESVTYRI